MKNKLAQSMPSSTNLLDSWPDKVNWQCCLLGSLHGIRPLVAELLTPNSWKGHKPSEVKNEAVYRRRLEVK